MVEDLLVQFWSRNCLYMFTIFLSSKQWFLFNSYGFTFHTIGPWIMIFFVTLFIPIFINQISTHNWKKERGSTANFVYNDALYALWWFAISIVNNFRWWLIAEKKIRSFSLLSTEAGSTRVCQCAKSLKMHSAQSSNHYLGHKWFIS